MLKDLLSEVRQGSAIVSDVQMECSFGWKSPMQMNAKKWALTVENSAVVKKLNLD